MSAFSLAYYVWNEADELNAENPDDVIDLKRIAEQAGLSEEIVREIRAEKLADVQSFSEESELEPELLTR